LVVQIGEEVVAVLVLRGKSSRSRLCLRVALLTADVKQVASLQERGKGGADCLVEMSGALTTAEHADHVSVVGQLEVGASLPSIRSEKRLSNRVAGDHHLVSR
jgi:hypothetical protein